MQVSVERTSELSRKMTVSIPNAVVNEKMESRFKALAREVKVAGFRPGKVPANIVKKMYGDRVRSEVTGDLIQTTYYQALQQENLAPIGHPHIQAGGDQGGFEYIAEFEVYPQISLDALGSLQIVRPLAVVSESDIDTMIEKLRQQKKTWHDVDRTAQIGDRVTINFSCVCEGEPLTDGKVENYLLEIGTKQMIPGFEDEVEGLKAGDQKTFSVIYPETFNSEKLAGKSAEFDIEVIKVEEPVLPEVESEFIKAYGVEDGEINSFRADVKSNMERELGQGLKNKMKNSVLDALYDSMTISIPKVLIDQEMQGFIERAKSMQVNLDQADLRADKFENQAKRRVALGLILNEIVAKNNITVDAGRVRSVIEDIAKSYEQPEEVVNWYYAEKNRLNDVQQMVLEDSAIDWVVGQANVNEESFSFIEVMEKQQIEA